MQMSRRTRAKLRKESFLKGFLAFQAASRSQEERVIFHFSQLSIACMENCGKASSRKSFSNVS